MSLGILIALKSISHWSSAMMSSGVLCVLLLWVSNRGGARGSLCSATGTESAGITLPYHPPIVSQSISTLALYGDGDIVRLVHSFAPFSSRWVWNVATIDKMEQSRALIPLLVSMMLLTGVCNTLLTKYQVRPSHIYPTAASVSFH